MTTILTIAERINLPRLLSYGSGVYFWDFYSASTTITIGSDSITIDDTGNLSTTIIPIVGVRYGDERLSPVDSIADCITAEGSFFHDLTTGRCYFHLPGTIGAHFPPTNKSTADRSSITVSDNFNKNNQNKYGGQYYPGILESVTNIGLAADPLKFGLVAAQNATVRISNVNGLFDSYGRSLYAGALCQVKVSFDDTAENATEVFYGYTFGGKKDARSITLNLIQQRFFDNSPVCQNQMFDTEYPNIDDANIGRFKPVAFGTIIRGIAIPTNYVDPSVGGTIVFLLADASVASINSISALYDDSGNSVSYANFSATNCTVEYTLAAGSEVNPSAFTWSGVGYDLGFGTDNNGLDIIRFCFDKFGNVPYIASTYDQTTWASRTSANPQYIGISYSGELGFIDAVLQPITVSLQGVVATLGDGRITFLDRNTNADPVETITYAQMLEEPSIDVDTSAFVSAVTVQHSGGQKVTYSGLQSEILETYGVDTLGNISPVLSALALDLYAEQLGIEIMSTSKGPEETTTAVVPMTEARFAYLPFNMIYIDRGRYRSPDVQLHEILSVQPDSGRRAISITARTLPA